jgi:hypothetical protein
MKKVLIEAINGGASRQTMRDLSDQRIARQVVEGVERDHLVAEALECPETIE